MKTTTSVGDDIESKEGGWEFDDSVADTFDSHVANSIPNYHAIQHQVCKLSDWFLTGRGGETVYDLGCATGETIARLLAHHEFDDPPTFIGIDEAPPMLERAREKIANRRNVRLVERDITVEPSFPGATFVTSLFTLSFLRESNRARVVDAIYRDLDRGGGAVVVEKTYPRAARWQSAFREHYFDFKRQTHDDDEILGKAQSLRGQLRPLTVREYEMMFADAGFDSTEVQPFYRWNMWVGWVLRKR